MEMTDRKKQILKIVVEEYVAAAEPVGSKAIAQRMPGKISSATIRNELADLTEMGYLEQPHTSAGRVPSAKGYRLYVNELMEHRALSREEEDKLNASLAEKLAGTDQLMARAGQMVSSFVGYPGLYRGGSQDSRHRAAVRADSGGCQQLHCRGDAVGQPGEKPAAAAAIGRWPTAACRT